MRQSRAKPNGRRPPPGWEVYPVWIARGPTLSGGVIEDGVGGDGELQGSRADAVVLAWSEYEAVQEHLAEAGS